MPRIFRLAAALRLLTAYAISRLGDWLGEIALALVVLRTTGSALAVTAVFVLGTFVPAAAGPVLVARLGGKRALPLLLAGEGALFAVAAGCATTAPLAVLLALVLADGALGVAARGLLKAALVAATRPVGALREGNAALTAL